MNLLEKCEQHPRYRGKNKPRTRCLQCWRIWLSDPYAFRWMELSVDEIRDIMLLMGGHI